jgi:FAD/FMN-containing dehydrogenase
MNPHWGEQIGLHSDHRVSIRLVFQGLERAEAQAVWQPFFDWVKASPADYETTAPLILALPAQRFWDSTLLTSLPGVVKSDDRPGAAAEHFFWSGDGGQVGQVLHAYESTWLSQSLLHPDRFEALVDALTAAANQWSVGLHFNKGLAGAPPAALAAARDTATNPAVLDAFALAILGSNEGPAFPGIAGHEPDAARARRHAASLHAAGAILRRLQDRPASYVSESDYFQADWQEAFWGANHARLGRAKAQYDPHGLFFTHHGVGSERWSADGFERVG